MTSQHRNRALGFFAIAIMAGCGAPPVVPVMDLAMCAAPTMLCGEDCVDTATDVRNCGGCGKACEVSQTCKAGRCELVCAGGASICGVGGGGMPFCTNLQSDVRNCGACGTACPPGNVCNLGKCALSCQKGLTDCNGSCADLEANAAHCGACGNACPMGSACVAHVCTVSCPQPQSVCGGQCVDTQTDTANCGMCGTACAQGSSCQKGSCMPNCQPQLTNCNGTCVDTRSDAANCGACDKACGKGELCSGSTCVLDCPAPFTACNGACVDTRNDLSNCGACGNACSFANGVADCQSGACVLTSCKSGYGDCDATTTNGCEKDVQSDVANCGACGYACTNGWYCVSGRCSQFPATCSTSTDVSGAQYTICAMNQTGAWIAGNNKGGCSFAALDICKKYGFTKVTRWGGTCGTICGYCSNKYSCASPQGSFTLGGNYTTYDSGGGNPNTGNITCTVHWECSP